MVIEHCFHVAKEGILSRAKHIMSLRIAPRLVLRPSKGHWYMKMYLHLHQFYIPYQRSQFSKFFFTTERTFNK